MLGHSIGDSKELMCIVWLYKIHEFRDYIIYKIGTLVGDNF